MYQRRCIFDLNLSQQLKLIKYCRTISGLIITDSSRTISVCETSVIFNHLTRLIALEDFIKYIVVEILHTVTVRIVIYIS
jgi:hypothetical protein